MIKIEPNKKNALDKVSAADCFQVRSVSQSRFMQKMGGVSKTVMTEIQKGLIKVLSLDEE